MVDISLIPKEFNPILIKKNSKKPKGNWKRYKTEIYPRENFKNHNGNVGIHCGKISNNLLILDWDFKEDKKDNFKIIYVEFLKAFPRLANTYTIETPHGYHFYYYMLDFLETRHPIKNALFIHSKKLNKDIFTGTIKTKFYEHLAGWDILGQEGYALVPPSEINGNKYILRNDMEICKISLSEFEEVKKFFLLDKIKKPRKPFIDIMNGVIEIETYSIETDQKEFVYWKNLFREMWHYCGMEPYEVYKFLEANQPAFDKDKSDVQLQHHPYTDNPLSNEYMKKYFPNYYTHKTTITNTEIVLKDLVQKTISPTTSRTGLSNKTVPFDIYDIIISDSKITKCLFKTNKKGEVYLKSQVLILDGKLKLDKKTYDFKINNRELFSFWFNDYYYHTMGMDHILRLLTPYMYQGSSGRDVIKRVFNVLGEEIRTVKPEYILGFNNGWKLPQLEETNDYMIITYTDLQRNIYNRVKKIVRKYTDKEKIKTLKTFQSLIGITQNRENLAVLLAWSVSAPFRLAILDYCDIFPHLFNVGKPVTGKNALEKTFITDFYKTYDKMLSPYTLESTARLENHLSESTFPHVITEVHKVKNINTGPILKTHATGTDDFERQKDQYEMAYKKPKVAPLSLDSNYSIKLFEDPAMNTKIIVNEFEKQISVDPEWKKLNRKLKKEKLFSFIYDYTKDWTNKDVFQLLNKQYDVIQEEYGLEKLQKLEKEHPRLINIYQILLFGIELLKVIFDVEFTSINIALKSIKIGRQFITMELKDQFFAFCKSAVEFEADSHEPYYDKIGNEKFKKIRGSNPKYLTCLLRLNKNEYYCFTQDNLRDFNEYSKKNYGLKELNNLIKNALTNKEDIQLVNKYIEKIRTRYIQIKKGLF